MSLGADPVLMEDSMKLDFQVLLALEAMTVHVMLGFRENTIVGQVISVQ